MLCILQYDAENGQVKLIFSPAAHSVEQFARDASLIRGTSLLSKEMSIMEEDGGDETHSQLTQGAVNCMALHKNGLYIGGNVCTYTVL